MKKLTIDPNHPRAAEFKRLTDTMSKHRHEYRRLHKRRAELLATPIERAAMPGPVVYSQAPVSAPNPAAVAPVVPVPVPAPAPRKPTMADHILALFGANPNRIYQVAEVAKALGLGSRLNGPVASAMARLVVEGKLAKGEAGRFYALQ